MHKGILIIMQGCMRISEWYVIHVKIQSGHLIKNIYKTYVWTPHFRLLECISHSNGELDFYLLFENDLESPLIFVLFLKGKQNKKENPKCDSLFWKR